MESFADDTNMSTNQMDQMDVPPHGVSLVSDTSSDTSSDVAEKQQAAELHPQAKDERKSGAIARCWWRELPESECCPLSGFPVSLLPYPPFRFRVDPLCPDEVVLVDGKYLVLQAWVSGSMKVYGRQLVNSDISAIDTYISRCNLGRIRLASLQELECNSGNSEQKKKFESQREWALKELKKLRRIQDARLRRIQNNGVRKGKHTKKGAGVQSTDSPRVDNTVAESSCPKSNLDQFTAAIPESATMCSAGDVVKRKGATTGDWAGEALCCEHWRHSTLAAKADDDLASKRLENAAWRLWVSGSNDYRGCIIHAEDLLKWMDLEGSSSLPQVPSSPSWPSQREKDETPVAHTTSEKPLHSAFTTLHKETFSLFNEDPKDILHELQIGKTLTEKRAGISDGQLRSRRENLLWRTLAMSRNQSPKASVRTTLPADPNTEKDKENLQNVATLCTSELQPKTLVLEDLVSDHGAQGVQGVRDAQVTQSTSGTCPPGLKGLPGMTGMSAIPYPTMCLPQGYVCVAVPASLLPQVHQMQQTHQMNKAQVPLGKS